MNRSSDLITIKEAAHRSERSVVTIKRWIRAKKLKAHRKTTGKTAPVYIDSHELSMILTNTEPGRVVHGSVNEALTQGATSKAAGGLIKALNDQISTLQAQAENARADHAIQIDSLQATIKDLRADKERMLAEVADLRARLVAVERELNGGVRGLLRGWIGGKR